MKRLFLLGIVVCLMITFDVMALEKPGVNVAIQTVFSREMNTKADEINNNISFGKASFSTDGEVNNRVSYLVSVIPDKEHKITILDARMHYQAFSWLKIEGGQIKSAFSMENEIYFAKADFIQDTKSKQVINGRDLGVQAKAKVADFDVSLGVLNGVAGLNKPEDNNRKDFVGRLLWHPVKHASVGLAIYQGWAGPDQDKKNRYSLQAEYKPEEWHIRSEYVFADNKKDNQRGFYLQAGYKIFQNLECLVRGEIFGAKDDPLKELMLGVNIGGWKAQWQINYLARLKESDAIYVAARLHL